MYVGQAALPGHVLRQVLTKLPVEGLQQQGSLDQSSA